MFHAMGLWLFHCSVVGILISCDNRLEFPLGGNCGSWNTLLSSRDRLHRNMEAPERSKNYSLQCLTVCSQAIVSRSISRTPFGTRPSYRGWELAYTPPFRDDVKS